jgi:hypothetical protein
MPRVVTPDWMFQLDDAGAVIGEDHRAVRTRQDACEINHCHA